MEWNAIHLYIHDTDYHNRFLVDFLKPEITKMEEEGILAQFFYILYWQGGNHIRFRYKSPQKECVRGRVYQVYTEFLKEYQPQKVLTKEQYYAIYSKNKENVSDITFIDDKSFCDMRYEPEIERYGGEKSISYNEKIFSLSSKYALHIRESAKGNLMKQIIGGLDMFTLALKNVSDKKMFLEYYMHFWKEFSSVEQEVLPINKIVQMYKERYTQLLAGEHRAYEEWDNGFEELLKNACEKQSAYKDESTAKNMLIASQVHMTHNRLGLMPRMECDLAKILYECECG